VLGTQSSRGCRSANATRSSTRGSVSEATADSASDAIAGTRGPRSPCRRNRAPPRAHPAATTEVRQIHDPHWVALSPTRDAATEAFRLTRPRHLPSGRTQSRRHQLLSSALGRATHRTETLESARHSIHLAAVRSSNATRSSARGVSVGSDSRRCVRCNRWVPWPAATPQALERRVAPNRSTPDRRPTLGRALTDPRRRDGGVLAPGRDTCRAGQAPFRRQLLLSSALGRATHRTETARTRSAPNPSHGLFARRNATTSFFCPWVSVTSESGRRVRCGSSGLRSPCRRNRAPPRTQPTATTEVRLIRDPTLGRALTNPATPRRRRFGSPGRDSHRAGERCSGRQRC
jgi:hypothetical protein